MIFKKSNLDLMRLNMLKDGYEHIAIDRLIEGVVDYSSIAHSKIEEQQNIINKEFSNDDEMLLDMSLDDEHYFIDEAKKLAHELSIIALYKKVEITVGRAVKIAYPEAPDRAFFKIDELKKFLKRQGITVKHLSGYAGMDETRVINNSIKHSGNVSKELARFSGWKKGHPLAELDKAYQRLAPLCADYVEALLTELIKNKKVL